MSEALVSIHLAVLLFGLSGLFGKFLSISPISIVLGRTIIASLTLGLFELRQNSLRDFDYRLKALGTFFPLGAVLAFHWYTFFLAIQISTVGIGLLAFATFPVFVSLLEPLFFKERLSPFDLICGGVSFLGLCLVVPSYDLHNNLFQGALIGVVSSASFAFLSVLNRLLVQSNSPVRVALLQNFFAALSLFPFALAVDTYSLTVKEWGLMLLLGIFCTAGAHSLYIRALSGIRAQTAAVIASLEPVYGMVFAYLLLGEVQTFRGIIGASIILAATLLVTFRASKKAGETNLVT